MRRELHQGWTVEAAGGEGMGRLDGPALAAVPGCVHLDLLAAGLVPDPYLDQNEAAAAWVGRTDWTYTTTFDWHPSNGARVDLVAEGLDTVAQVSLNGAVLGATRNMHRTYRFDVTGTVLPGQNRLTIAFRAPLDAAEAASAELGRRPHVNAHPYNALRKNASSFGWDWGPDLPTSGIWRPIALEEWSVARLASVRPLVDVRPDLTGVLQVHAGVERTSSADLVLRASVAGRVTSVAVPAGEPAAVATIEVPDAPLWWPRGYGAQPLAEVLVELLDGDVVLDSHRTRVGFRTVAVESGPDEHGTSFALRVNGTRVLVRGFNWIPDDAFPSRVDRARVERSVRQAFDSNANLLRVCGGGIYESDDFYDLCDELGLLVWQDFLFACAAYPQEEPLAGEVRAEAAEAIARLSPHPSLALWCGGNECLWGHADWGWEAPLAGLTWGLGYYTQTLPGLVAELDPGRPYIPGSPFSPVAGMHPNDPSHGPMHIWDVWNERDYTGYLSYTPRFVAEFGFQGPPSWATLTRAVHDEPLAPDSPGMLAHQKADDGNGKLARGLRGHLPDPAGMDDWHWATQLNQSRALATGIEHFRALAPICSGAVVWQLNDCWPVSSWAVVDGDGRLKPAWYAVRRAFRDRLAMIRQGTAGLELVALADSAQPWHADVLVERVSFEGARLAGAVVRLELDARSSVTVPLPADVATPGDPKRELLVARVDGETSFWWFAEDLDVAMPAPQCSVSAVRTEGGYDVTITARTLVKDLALLVDRLDPAAEVDDMLVTLLPGESVHLRVSCQRDLPTGAFAAAPVLRCANDLTAPVTDAGSGPAG